MHIDKLTHRMVREFNYSSECFERYIVGWFLNLPNMCITYLTGGLIDLKVYRLILSEEYTSELGFDNF